MSSNTFKRKQLLFLILKNIIAHSPSLITSGRACIVKKSRVKLLIKSQERPNNEVKAEKKHYCKVVVKNKELKLT